MVMKKEEMPYEDPIQWVVRTHDFGYLQSRRQSYFWDINHKWEDVKIFFTMSKYTILSFVAAILIHKTGWFQTPTEFILLMTFMFGLCFIPMLIYGLCAVQMAKWRLAYFDECFEKKCESFKKEVSDAAKQ